MCNLSIKLTGQHSIREKFYISSPISLVPRPLVPYLFQKFYRTDASHTKDGNGIGLYVVKHIVNLHNGKIDVKSQDCVTTFEVTLPL